MSDEHAVEYTFRNTPPTWPHGPVITLTKNKQNYCISPSVYTWPRHMLKDFFINEGGLKQIKYALWTFDMNDRDAACFANQVWKDFLNKMFPNGMPELLTRSEEA